jgi:hypothetical protein
MVAGGTKKIRANMLIEGDLNVTANDTFTTHGNTETLTVNGDVEVSGTLGATSQTGAYSFNSLTTQNGGTFVASSGTTTILVDIRNRTGATFTHNGGTVAITTGAMKVMLMVMLGEVLQENIPQKYLLVVS